MSTLVNCTGRVNFSRKKVSSVVVKLFIQRWDDLERSAIGDKRDVLHGSTKPKSTKTAQRGGRVACVLTSTIYVHQHVVDWDQSLVSAFAGTRSYIGELMPCNKQLKRPS